MALTVASIVTECAMHLPADEVDILAMLNIVNSELQFDLRLLPDINVQISLISGQQEYALSPSIMRVWAANLQTSETSFTPLIPTSVDRLYATNPIWSTVTPGTPTQFYERGGNIGFFLCPSVSTSGGFPIVNLTCSEQPAQLDINASLPAQVFSSDAWVYRICEKLSVKVAPDKFEIFSKLASRSKQQLLDYSYGLLARDKPSASYRAPRVNGV